MKPLEPSHETLDPAVFRAAMSRFASGVTVVTTKDKDGVAKGFTASAFTSLSLDPPLVLVCLDRRAESFEAFNQSDSMAISILAKGQAAIAMQFAAKGTDKFSAVAVEVGRATELPVIAGALAVVECAMHERLAGGDHVILVGRVVRAVVRDAEPLVHYDRTFGAFTSP